MSKVSLNFHARRDEIISLVVAWSREHDAALVAERFSPSYQARHFDFDDPRAAAADGVDRVSLVEGEPNLRVSSELDYLQCNPGAFTILLGKQSKTALHESFLAAMPQDERLARKWRRLKEQARKSMFKGAWAVNAKSGARVYDGRHYYTLGAKTLAESGVRLMGPTDWLHYEIGE